MSLKIISFRYFFIDIYEFFIISLITVPVKQVIKTDGKIKGEKLSIITNKINLVKFGIVQKINVRTNV